MSLMVFLAVGLFALLVLCAFCAAILVMAAVISGRESKNEQVQNIRVWYYKAKSTWKKKR